MKTQHLFSDICDNCSQLLIWAEYYEKGSLVDEKYQITEEEVKAENQQKYYKMRKVGKNLGVCECSDPFPITKRRKKGGKNA